MTQLFIQGEEFLGKAFEDTTTSYKFLFFKSLLDVINSTSGRNNYLNQGKTISLKNLTYLFILNAWYPINTFKLSFGKSDQIHRHIETLKTKFPNIIEFSKNKVDNQKFLKEISKLADTKEIKEIYNNLRRHVPYRFLTPWMKHEVKGINEPQKIIIAISEDDRKLPADNQKLPYHFVEKDNELYIEISEKFSDLIHTHSLLIYDWWKWNFASYLQKHNPLVPGIIYKLEQPEQRDLRIARIYWKSILEVQPKIHCIYSNELLDNEYDIDHFIPWSFIAHDQLWNLIPVLASANRTKSDMLPDLEKYLSSFLDLQVSSLYTFADKYVIHDSKKHDMIEKAEAGFAFSDRENLLFQSYLQQQINSKNEMRLMLESNIKLSYSLATKCGFTAGWKYTD